MNLSPTLPPKRGRVATKRCATFIELMIGCLSLLLIGGTALAAAESDLDPDKAYSLLVPPLPTGTSNIEVLEFFSYACSHCYHLHPLLSAWEKKLPNDVQLVYVPTIFSGAAEPYARTLYALESMGKLPLLHEAIYRAIHVEDVKLYDMDSLADFVEKNGVNKTQFKAAYDSLAMQPRVERAKQMIRSYRITGTPTLVVDGKYMVSGLIPEQMMLVLQHVVEKARNEHAQAQRKPKAKP